MLTYGSYLSKKQDILSCGSWVVLFDTMVAMLAGLMIFPAVFALGIEPDGGPALIFYVLPAVFDEMAGGVFVGTVFFFLLSLAALTSTVSLLEVVSAYFIDELDWTRTKTVWTAAAITLVIGIPSALAWVGAKPWGTANLLGFEGFFSLMDFSFVNVSLPLGAVLLCLFGSWVWGLDNAVAEIVSSSPRFKGFAGPWKIFVRFICPVFITIILIFQFVSLYK
jgi:NSS family neurotransmitter:Na+ symporter